MRRSFSAFSVLPMVLAVTGCSKKDHEAKAVSSRSDEETKKQEKSADEDDSSEGNDTGESKRKKQDGGNDIKGATGKSANAPFTANLEGYELKMTFGKAYASFSGMHVMLSNENPSCSYKPPSDDAWQVEFDVPPGPNQTFFGGHPIGISATFNSQKVKLKQTWASPHLATAFVEPFKLKEGEHITGTLEFDERYEESKADGSKKTYSYTGSGAFDVGICEDWNDFKKLPGLPGDAGEGDLAGTFGGEGFRYRTALAHVWHDKTNAVDYIESIEFYETAGVTCTSRFDVWKKASYFSIRSIGGASSRQMFIGTPQPADPSFSKAGPAPGGKGTMGVTKWFGGIGGRHAWVQFDKLELKGGGTVAGSVVAESGPDAKPEEKGKLAGKFEAKVCGSLF